MAEIVSDVLGALGQWLTPEPEHVSLSDILPKLEHFKQSLEAEKERREAEEERRELWKKIEEQITENEEMMMKNRTYVESGFELVDPVPAPARNKIIVLCRLSPEQKKYLDDNGISHY